MEDARASYYQLARHLPGIGGPAGYDGLELDEVLDLHRRLADEFRREEARIKAQQQANKARSRRR